MALRRFQAFRLVVGVVWRSLSSSVSPSYNDDALHAEDDEPSFSEMFRHSKFAQLGPSLRNRAVEGIVVKVIEDDMFVDFGGKFFATVKKPALTQQNQCFEGMLVHLALKDLEITEHFLGHSKHTTFLEADADLKGMQTSRSRQTTDTLNDDEPATT